MTTTPKSVSYLKWEPALKPGEAFKSAVNFAFPDVDQEGRAFWIEMRPSEAGRAVLVERARDGAIRDVTPPPYSVRSRVFEYGSTPYVVFKGWVYFVNLSDQRIYKQNLSLLSEITPVTTEKNADGSVGKSAELSVSPDGRWLAFAYETEGKPGENPNYVGLLDLSVQKPQDPKILVKGASFYKTPRFSPDGKQLAWLEWNHPFMPWDSTKLSLAKFHEGHVSEAKVIAGSDHSSIPAFTFGSGGEIYFSADHADQPETSPENFANIYLYEHGKTRAVTKQLADFNSVRAFGTKLAVLRVMKGQSQALLLDPKSGQETRYAADYAETGSPLLTSDGKVIVTGAPDTRPTEMLEILSSGETHVLRKSSDYVAKVGDVSRPELVEYPTEDGRTAYGYFYPPMNSRYSAPSGEKPPVRVLIHGGPVGATSRTFTLSKLFWTSQGYAIFDLNYRGSMGFGRAYRDAIKKKWGLIEIQDVKDGLAFLAKAGRISEQAIVSGGSAGGYTVQRLLTSYPDLFAAGASYYGIGNLVTLQEMTHKFEAHYLEQLIGGTLESNGAEYRARSPINHLERLKAPMIIFQGGEDKVVPPQNSREMAEILKRKGIPYEYYEYPDEGHGFRKRDNLVDCLTKEADFFRRVLTKQ